MSDEVTGSHNEWKHAEFRRLAQWFQYSSREKVNNRYTFEKLNRFG